MGIWRPFYIPQQPYNQNFLFFFSKKSVIQEEEENSEFFMRSMLLLLFQMEQFWTTRRTNQNDTFLTLSIYIYWMVLFRTVVVFCLFLTSMSPPTRFFHIRFFRKYWFLVWWSETNIEFCQWKFSHGQFQQRKQQQQQQILMMCQNKNENHTTNDTTSALTIHDN